MKQLTLFLLLTLFIISCGDDSAIVTKSDIIPIDKSKPLYVLEDGAKFYYEYTITEDGVDSLYLQCTSYINKKSYEYEGNPVDVFLETSTFLDRDTTNNVGYCFSFQDYIYYTVASNFDNGSIIKARKYFVNKLENKGSFPLNDVTCEASIDEFELDGVKYEAWKIVYNLNNGLEHWVKFVPGIGRVEEYMKSGGPTMKNKLYKYELN